MGALIFILAVYLAGCGVIWVATSPHRSRAVLKALGLALDSDLVAGAKREATLNSTITSTRMSLRDRERQIEDMYKEFDELDKMNSFSSRFGPIGFNVSIKDCLEDRSVRIYTSSVTRYFDFDARELSVVTSAPNYLAWVRRKLSKEWLAVIDTELGRMLSPETIMEELNPPKAKRRGSR